MNDRIRYTVGIGILVGMLMIGLIDLWLWQGLGWHYTISDVVRWAFEHWPMLVVLLPFYVGCLVGHLFLSLNKSK
jgi:hypothetical protein